MRRGVKFRQEFISHIPCLRFTGTNFCKIVDFPMLRITFGDKTRTSDHILGTTSKRYGNSKGVLFYFIFSLWS